MRTVAGNYGKGCALSESVGSDIVILRPIGLRTASGTVGWQTGVANLIEQRPIADVEGASRLLAVPVVMLQHLQNDLAFQFMDRLAGYLLQRDGPVDRDVGD